jgi:prepilin-type N-terminal cleavage/methylation domain-containing protein
MLHHSIKKRRSAGFTLVEMMIAALVMGIIVSTIAYAFFDILRTSSVARVKMQMQQDMRDTLGYMARMMRYAGIRPVVTAIEEVSDTNIIFQCDYNADQVVDRIEFAYNPETKSIMLTQWVQNGSNWDVVHDTQAVMDNITAMQFTFYTSNNQATTDPALVTAGKIALTMEPPDSAPGTIRAMVGDISMSAKVYCPNLAWRLPE